jgi:hypothetical protein
VGKRSRRERRRVRLEVPIPRPQSMWLAVRSALSGEEFGYQTAILWIDEKALTTFRHPEPRPRPEDIESHVQWLQGVMLALDDEPGGPVQ